MTPPSVAAAERLPDELDDGGRFTRSRRTENDIGRPLEVAVERTSNCVHLFKVELSVE